MCKQCVEHAHMNLIYIDRYQLSITSVSLQKNSHRVNLYKNTNEQCHCVFWGKRFVWFVEDLEQLIVDFLSTATFLLRPGGGPPWAMGWQWS